MHEVWVFLGGAAVGLVTAAGVLVTLAVMGPKTPYPARGGDLSPGVGFGGSGPKESNLDPNGGDSPKVSPEVIGGVKRPRRRHRTMWDDADGSNY